MHACKLELLQLGIAAPLGSAFLPGDGALNFALHSETSCKL